MRERKGNLVLYSIEKPADEWKYRVKLPGRSLQSFPLHSVIGGKRFGVSFIVKASAIESQVLDRTALVEARYMLDAETQRLKLSPGFPLDKPHNYETAIGRVLSPEFAEKCMECHGGTLRPSIAAGETHPAYEDFAVRCERCHGPGAAHAAAMKAHEKESRIIHPRRLSRQEQMRLCGKCHSGFSPVPQPRPDDLLISNQVTALSQSECYIQSDAGFSCISCHNPHRNAQHGDPVYEAVCLSCHVPQHTAVALCPVKSQSGCVGCHMPAVLRQESFKLTDHWIRVREQREGSPDAKRSSVISHQSSVLGQQGEQRSIAGSPKRDLPDRQQAQSSPTEPLKQVDGLNLKRVFLRILVLRTEREASEMLGRLNNGDSFDALARQFSIDPTAARGGYMGEVWLEKMSDQFRAVARSLRPGTFSSVFGSGIDFAILYRMPRNFRDQAFRLEQEAERLLKEKRFPEAIQTCRRALEDYPDFVHGYFSLGVAYGEAGDAAAERESYLTALRIAPDFQEAHYNLAQLLMAHGDVRGAIQELLQVIRIKPDHAEAYVNLSALYQALGDSDNAVRVALRAVETNPVLATAYYNLGLAQASRDLASALHSFEVASVIDPRHADARINAAVALAKLGRTEEAVARLKKLLSEKPNLEAAREALSQLSAARSGKRRKEK